MRQAARGGAPAGASREIPNVARKRGPTREAMLPNRMPYVCALASILLSGSYPAIAQPASPRGLADGPDAITAIPAQAEPSDPRARQRAAAQGPNRAAAQGS